jgi:hypothetical protein
MVPAIARLATPANPVRRYHARRGPDPEGGHGRVETRIDLKLIRDWCLAQVGGSAGFSAEAAILGCGGRRQVPGYSFYDRSRRRPTLWPAVVTGGNCGEDRRGPARRVRTTASSAELPTLGTWRRAIAVEHRAGPMTDATRVPESGVTRTRERLALGGPPRWLDQGLRPSSAGDDRMSSRLESLHALRRPDPARCLVERRA